MRKFTDKLPELSRLTFGTGGITDPTDPKCLAVARMAMDANLWFHVSDYGGGVYATLKKVIREDMRAAPRCIVKLDGLGAARFLASVEDALMRTGLEHIHVGQICGNPVGKQMEELAEAMHDMRELGVVSHYIMDVIYSYSSKVASAIEQELFAGYIYYYNVMECELSDAVEGLVEEKNISVLAMRTFGGRDGNNYLTAEPSHQKRMLLEPYYQRSGCSNRIDFCVRFALSNPVVRTTIGSTSNPDHFNEMLEAARSPRPLSMDVVMGIRELHRRWNANR